MRENEGEAAGGGQAGGGTERVRLTACSPQHRNEERTSPRRRMGGGGRGGVHGGRWARVRVALGRVYAGRGLDGGSLEARSEQKTLESDVLCKVRCGNAGKKFTSDFEFSAVAADFLSPTFSTFHSSAAGVWQAWLHKVPMASDRDFEICWAADASAVAALAALSPA